MRHVLVFVVIVVSTLGCYKTSKTDAETEETDRKGETDTSAVEGVELQTEADENELGDFFAEQNGTNETKEVEDMEGQVCVRKGDVNNDGTIDEQCVYFGAERGGANDLLFRNLTLRRHGFGWMNCFEDQEDEPVGEGSFSIEHDKENQSFLVGWNGPTPDGFTRSYIVTYDENGRVVLFNSIMYTPAALESVYTYDYDQKGNVSTREYDAKNDSITDFIVYYTYDSETRTVTEERDTDANGEIDERYTYEYNAEGYLVEENKNPSQDGASEERIVYDYVFDEDGLITELNWEKSEGELIHLYDEDGNYSKVAEYEVLSKTTAKYQYDDEGRVVVVEYAVTQGDYPGAEPKKQRHLYTYDEQGNIRSHEQDCDCDGKRESLVVYSYDCEPLEDSSVGDSSN